MSKDITEEIIQSTIKTHREEQVKYIYYKIGICVASIGFLVSKTYDEKFTLIHIPLILCMLSLLASIYTGFKFIEHFLGILYINKEHLDPRDENGNKFTGDLKIHNDETKKNLLKIVNDTRYYDWNNYTLLISISLFILWYIVRIVY